jgi:hypothetical protein
MTSVALSSSQCRFAQWSYLAGSGFLSGTRGQDVTSISALPPGPPYFVHVLVYAAARRDDLPFALPHGRPQRLTDTLLQSSRPAAVSLGPVRWAGHNGQLLIAPSYPAGGELGSHLVFSYRTQGQYHGISLHPWPGVYRYRTGGLEHAVRLIPSAAYPQELATLRAIVDSCAPESS